MNRLMSRRTRRAYTMLEIVVSIGVISVLLGILLPSLYEARLSAMTRMIETRQQDSHTALRLYSGDHRDAFPYYGVPRTLEAVTSFNGYPTPDWYWGQGYWWAAFVTHLGYEATGAIRSSPSESDAYLGFPHRPRYAFMAQSVLTLTALASPRYWAEYPEQRIDRHVPQRWTTITHTTRKGVLLRTGWFDVATDGPAAPQMITFGDGHLETVEFKELRPGVPLFYWGGARVPVLTTRSGLHGRDL